ncbi:MAG: tRNA uridine-5-carboxymethylaminomethyl(34) synthesis GTPase MnmE [Oscillospiraceae bacterium]
MNNLMDTIAAIATPAGAGGIGIIKISGEDAFAVADRVVRLKSGEKLDGLPGFTARLGTVCDSAGHLIDEAVLLVYRAPKSYTGENTVEIMCHGGEVVCETVLREALQSGACMATRGEFTRRAFVNGRISLTEAEAVCDIINAASKQGEAAAAALVNGALNRKTESLKAKIIELQAHITAYIDFPEEDVDEVDSDELARVLSELQSELKKLCDSFELGTDIMRGVPATIVGSPNVGKSTLLNLLAGAPKALVTPIAGTTRDVVEQKVRLGGTTLMLADTAGIRDSDDLVESMGIELAKQKIDQSSLVLAVFDSSRPLDGNDRALIQRLKNKRAIAVVNKTDLQSEIDTNEIKQAFQHVVFISANDDNSLLLLDRAVAKAIKTDNLNTDEPILANERQRSCALRALELVEEAVNANDNLTLDVVFALLSEGLEALSELSGENASEAVLDEVFSHFCVGK